MVISPFSQLPLTLTYSLVEFLLESGKQDINLTVVLGFEGSTHSLDFPKWHTKVNIVMGKAQAIQADETPYVVNYPIKIRQTLIGAKVIKTEGPK